MSPAKESSYNTAAADWKDIEEVTLDEINISILADIAQNPDCMWHTPSLEHSNCSLGFNGDYELIKNTEIQHDG